MSKNYVYRYSWAILCHIYTHLTYNMIIQRGYT